MMDLIQKKRLKAFFYILSNLIFRNDADFYFVFLLRLTILLFIHINLFFILSNMLFDTHTHTYFSELVDRQDEIVANMRENNIHYATQIGCDIETSKQAIELTKKYKEFYATIGYHPTEGQSLAIEEIPKIVKELEQLIIVDREISGFLDSPNPVKLNHPLTADGDLDIVSDFSKYKKS